MRKGLIKMSDAIYKDEWQSIYVFFKDFRPTHIEFRHWENNTWYFYGESNLFEELKEGDAIPQYDVLFTRQENGSLKYQIVSNVRN